MEASNIRDSVPRLRQLLPHMRAQLIGLRNGTTFEQARRQYSKTVDDLAAQGLGRSSASRVGDKDKHWSPTRDLLEEAMRLGFVENQKLPSARKYLDAYRDCNYRLTAVGEEAMNQAEEDVAAFCDELAIAVYHAHPYFRQFIRLLEERPLICPEITESEIEKSRKAGNGTEYLVEYMNERLEQDASRMGRQERIREIIVAFVRHRFGRTPGKQPTNKELKEAVKDAFAEASIKLRGLPAGATDLDMLKSWGTQLRLLDQSRYVPEFEGQNVNVIWLASDIDERPKLRIRRRTYEKHWEKVSEAIIDSYHSQASKADSHLTAPYLPIYRVRAEAAFRCEVTRALVDLVIERLSEGEVPDTDIQLWLHLGTTRQPDSEPVYRRNENRRYEMTIQPR